MNVVAELRTARRYITSVLLNLDLNANETHLSTFIEMIEYFAENPQEYREMIDARQRNSK